MNPCSGITLLNYVLTVRQQSLHPFLTKSSTQKGGGGEFPFSFIKQKMALDLKFD